MQRVLHELEGRHWDAVAFAETWRSECDEAWKLDGGIRGLVVVGLEAQEVWAFSCTVDGFTLFSDQSRRDCACWM